MPDILRWLFEQPLLLLLLIAWIFSALGGVMQRVARRAQAEARRAADATDAGADAAQPHPGRRDADEIAREIRRAMGLEPPAPPQPRPPLPQREPRAVETAVPQHPRRAVDHGEAERRRTVDHDRRPPRLVIVPDEVAPRRSVRPPLNAGDIARAAADARLVAPGARRRRTRTMLDLSRPAAALVAAEVLGPPLALRPTPFPREPRDH